MQMLVYSGPIEQLDPDLDSISLMPYNIWVIKGTPHERDGTVS